MLPVLKQHFPLVPRHLMLVMISCRPVRQVVICLVKTTIKIMNPLVADFLSLDRHLHQTEAKKTTLVDLVSVSVVVESPHPLQIIVHQDFFCFKNFAR